MLDKPISLKFLKVSLRVTISLQHILRSLEVLIENLNKFYASREKSWGDLMSLENIEEY